MSLGLDALEEAYVNAIYTILEIDDDHLDVVINPAYKETIQDHLKELRPEENSGCRKI